MTLHCSSTDFTSVVSVRQTDTQKVEPVGRRMGDRMTRESDALRRLVWQRAWRHYTHIHRALRRRRRQQVWRLNYPVNYRPCRTDGGGLARWYISAWSPANKRVRDRSARGRDALSDFLHPTPIDSRCLLSSFWLYCLLPESIVRQRLFILVYHLEFRPYSLTGVLFCTVAFLLH